MIIGNRFRKILDMGCRCWCFMYKICLKVVGVFFWNLVVGYEYFFNGIGIGLFIFLFFGG